MARAAIVVLAVLACAAATGALAHDKPRVIKETWPAPPAEWARVQRADASAMLEVVFAVKQTNSELLEDTLFRVSDPDSPDYGKHLSLEEVNNLVAPKPEHILSVINFLVNHGVNVQRDGVATSNSDFITVKMTVAKAEELLGTQYYEWTHTGSNHNITVIRANAAYSLPEDVHAAVDFVGPTIRFPRIQRLTIRKPSPDAFGVTPAFLRKLYNVGDATGSASNNRQAVASFLGQYYSPSDLQTFFKSFSSSEVGKTADLNGPNDPSNPGDEASLDIEYIMSVGTNVKTTFFSTTGQQPHNPGNEPFLKWLTTVAGLSGDAMPKTISTSYGDDENTVNYGYAVRVSQEFQKAGARGISLMFASGDGGVGGSQPSICTKFVPTFPAANPFVTAVGGSQNYNPEVTAGLSGGGFSNYWGRPSYQTQHVKHYFSVAKNLPASNLYNHTGAGFPDVAAQAENFNIVLDGFTTLVAGTSCAAPTFSGVLSLVNDARLAAGKSSLGWLNPLFYKNPSAFNDITSGNNPGCGTNGFQAAQGWDPTTGLGTPDYAKLKSVVEALP